MGVFDSGGLFFLVCFILSITLSLEREDKNRCLLHSQKSQSGWPQVVFEIWGKVFILWSSFLHFVGWRYVKDNKCTSDTPSKFNWTDLGVQDNPIFIFVGRRYNYTSNWQNNYNKCLFAKIKFYFSIFAFTFLKIIESHTYNKLTLV